MNVNYELTPRTDFIKKTKHGLRFVITQNPQVHKSPKLCIYFNFTDYIYEMK